MIFRINSQRNLTPRFRISKIDLKSDRKRFLEDQEAFRQVRQRIIARDAKMKRSSKVLGHLQLARKACVATDIPAASSRTVCKKCSKCPPKARPVVQEQLTAPLRYLLVMAPPRVQVVQCLRPSCHKPAYPQRHPACKRPSHTFFNPSSTKPSPTQAPPPLPNAYPP